MITGCNLPQSSGETQQPDEDDHVPCNTDALVTALENAPSVDTLEISLTPDCVYEFSEPYTAGDPMGASALPPITTDVIIHGNHAKITRSIVGDPPASGFRFFHLEGGALSFDSLYLENGGWAEVIVECQSAGNCGNGGAIYVESASLSISNSTLTSNAGLMGGAILVNASSSLSIGNSLFEGNFAETGGAIMTYGVANVFNCTFRSNTVDLPGGGSRGGAFYNAGDLIINETTLDGNLGRNGGGAIFNSGTLSVANSTIIHNWSSGTSGITNHGVLTITNSTISNNHSGYSAGFGYSLPSAAISHSEGITEIDSTTIVENQGSGPGVSASRAGTVQISNSIIANNQGGDCYILADILVEGSANQDSDGSCAQFTHHGDPRIGPLANNGGPTLTHSLLFNSPAVDAALGDCPDTDQRGVQRPEGSGCDLGAYEHALLSIGGLPPFLPEAADPEPETSEYSADALLPEGEPSKPSHTGRIDQAVPCFNGPGPMYAVVSSLQPGALVEIIGISENGEYIVVLNPCYPGVPCWAKESSIELHDRLDPSRVIPDPEVPEQTEEEQNKAESPSCEPYMGESECKAAGGTYSLNSLPPCGCPP